MNSTSRLIVPIAVIGLLVWFFSDALFRSGMFVFRDAAHYYYPLFQFVGEEWAAGRVPLWNPYENLGQPLAGDSTASVFYPGKLIFALPLEFSWAYRLYILGHVLLAAAAAYRLARHVGATVEAAGVCAISYAFSGNVLMQYCNVVYLVGAAWLPVAMLAADRMLGQGAGARARWAVGFGVVLALMVIGGDPQMAYNAGLLAAMYAIWLWWGESSLSLWERVRAYAHWTTQIAPGGSRGLAAGCRSPHEPPASAGGYEFFLLRELLLRALPSRLVLLALAAVIGFVLSAVQVLPSMEFAGHSQRVAGSVTDHLRGRVEPGTHQEHVYHFSVGPWRLAEYVWPNFSGRQFPVHRRWLEVIPAEGRIWTPSLYMGLLPLLLALSAMRLRRGRPRPGEPQDSSSRRSDTRDHWLSWAVLMAVVGSFGWHGLGWLAQEIRIAAGGDVSTAGPVGSPFGGLYWLLTLILPGYVYFRYPAKLLVVAALGLSVLAARGWDRTFAGPSDRFRRGLLWLGGLSLAGAIGALVVRPFWHGWLSRVKPDVLFGPLDTTGAANDLLRAFLQTTVLCGLSWWLLRKRKRGQDPILAKKGPVPFLILVLVAIDLAMANGWLVACAPASQWKGRSKLAAVLSSLPDRVYRHATWMRPEWQSSRSLTRLADSMQWDVDTLRPKYNLASRVPLAEVHGAMILHDYQTFLEVGKEMRFAARPGAVPFALAKYVILPGNKVLPEGERIEVDVEDASLWRDAQHLPRAWIVHQADVLPPLESNDPAEIRRQTREVLLPRGRERDLRTSAVVECSGGACPAPSFGAKPLRHANAGQPRPPDGQSCRVVRYDPLHVEIDAELVRPGLVVLCDQFYPGWQLDVETSGVVPARRRVPILRTNRVMRGAWLPEGHHRLIYRYRPTSLICGAVISGLGWIGIALGLGWRLMRRRAGDG